MVLFLTMTMIVILASSRYVGLNAVHSSIERQDDLSEKEVEKVMEIYYEAESEIRLKMSLITVVCIIMSSFVTSYILLTYVSKPLKQLTEIIHKISLGDFDVEVDKELTESNISEIRQLANAFKRVMTSMKIMTYEKKKKE